MENLRVDCLELGELPTNTYVLSNEKKECLIIDPSDGFDEITDFLSERSLKPSLICLTHGHDDHFGSVNALRQKYGILAGISKEEEDLLISVNYNLSRMFGHPRVLEADLFFLDGQKVPLLGTEMTVILTPGHTPGGCCFYFLFSGDSLFAGSVGRTDFPGGSGAALLRSLREKIMTLPDDVRVYSGHGPSTTIGQEKAYNPYVNGDF